MTPIATAVVLVVVLLIAIYVGLRAVLCALPKDRDGVITVKLLILTIHFEIRRNDHARSK